ncbi:Serine--tRNA ligase [Buchnera aphidicola (Thelaxes suberi)]|uniref:serine--tRNA ligase n=1 Tax=Buchnera aphidicola TaxID=9 RepID=UPI0034645F92
MLNIKLMMNQLNFFKKKLALRGFFLDIHKIQQIEYNYKNLKIKIEFLQHKRNILNKLISKYIKKKKKILFLRNKSISINTKLLLIKEKMIQIKKNRLKFYMNIPNIPDKIVPKGTSHIDNIEIFKWGDIKNFNFKIKDHVILGNLVDGLDWKSGSQITGSRFVVMSNKIALLHRALGQFMLDTHILIHGYTEINVPYIVNEKSLYGTGQLPKFKKELFQLYNEDEKNNKYFLIPTSEVPLINIFQSKKILCTDLPIKLTSLTSCFRSESASYGLDTKGLIRMHQFDKVELVQIVHPEQSNNALEELTLHAEKILKLLKLPYRKILLCSKDLSFAATKTYDLEVWFPSQNMYREVSSCSNINDFQSRRINLKIIKSFATKKEKFFPHTLNGSGLAIGRVLAAIMENNQTANGDVLVPKVLQKKYMHGIKIINSIK